MEQLAPFIGGAIIGLLLVIQWHLHQITRAIQSVQKAIKDL